MLVTTAVQLTMLATAAMLWESRTDAASSTFRVCGRKLSELMSKVCQVHNSPPWDAPTVVEQSAAALRRKREAGGIADECCVTGCSFSQLAQYCYISVNPDTFLDDSHLIEDRSAEDSSSKVTAPAVVGIGKEEAGEAARREVGRTRRGGYGRKRAQRGRCGRCQKRRRTTTPRTPRTPRTDLMGNMPVAVRNVARAAPVVGTVSPLLTWGRTLNTDLPNMDRDRYAYLAVYST